MKDHQSDKEIKVRVLIGALVNAKMAKKGSYDMPLQFARSLQTKIRSKTKEGQRPKSER